MAGTRALFASIGAGVALVAAAALSLLTISAVFAFGGWSDSASGAVAEPMLITADASSPDPEVARSVAAVNTTQIVAPAPPPRPEPRRARSGSNRDNARATAPATTGVSLPGTGSAPDFDAPRAQPTANLPAPAQAPPAARKPGDHVRKAGDSLSATVQNAGTALSEATQPLAPPVSAAVQQVLNLVAEIVRRTADGLGSTLDALLPKK